MTGRDRIVVIALAVLVLIGGGWMLLVSPKRKEATAVEAKVATAQKELTSAETSLANARAAQSQYATAYAAVVNLGKAVPPSQEVASLVYQLEEASNARQVTFESIVSGLGSAAPTTPSSSSSSSSKGSTTTTASAAAASGFSQMPFTFVFSGGFFSLEHLFRQLTAFTTPAGPGGLHVSGRLLTIQGVKLAPEITAKGTTLKGTVTAAAYVLPAGQTLTAGATPSSPSGATPAAGGSTSSPTTPAVAKVAP
jgi:hypothetical protein